MGSKSSAWFSNEEMLASIDPMKKYNMSAQKRLAARFALDFWLSQVIISRRGIRSKFPGISYSDCKNLLAYATKYTKFPYPGAYSPFWMELVEELQSMVKKDESSPKAISSKQTNSDTILSPVLESNGIGIGGDRIPFPIPVPCAEQIAKGSYQNSGEQHLRGLINNQTGYVSGNGNGSYINVTIMEGCKILVTNENQVAD